MKQDISQAINRIIWGILLATFHINLFGIPIFPSIVGIALWMEGMKMIDEAWTESKEERDQSQRMAWIKRARSAGRFLLILSGLELILDLLKVGNYFWLRQFAAAFTLTEAVCGFSVMNSLEEMDAIWSSDQKRSHTPEWYLLFMLAELAVYEYAALIMSSGWNIVAAGMGILARIILAVFLSGYAGHQRRE